MASRRFRGTILGVLGLCSVAVAFLALPRLAVFTARPSPPERRRLEPDIPFRRIPAGSFEMGLSQPDIDALLPTRSEPHWKSRVPTEGPRHRVAISRPFLLGTTEVTVGQFRAFVEATGYRTQAEADAASVGTGFKAGRWQRVKPYCWHSLGIPLRDDLPVVNVTHSDAVAFCAWLTEVTGVTHRLPTEAEWEYACRAGTTTPWSYGADAKDAGAFSWWLGNSNDAFQPVGQKEPNAWGLHDLHGNVWEWCADWFAPGYESAAVRDPVGPATGTDRVLRGGAFNYDPAFQRSSYRAGYPPNRPYHKFGFRVVREIPAT